jgi:hypothetical protein
MLGLGVEPADAEVPGEAIRPVEVAGGVAVPAGVGWIGELGASCAQAAITTRLLAGSALPPTPLRSTK